MSGIRDSPRDQQQDQQQQDHQQQEPAEHRRRFPSALPPLPISLKKRKKRWTARRASSAESLPSSLRRSVIRTVQTPVRAIRKKSASFPDIFVFPKKGGDQKVGKRRRKKRKGGGGGGGGGGIFGGLNSMGLCNSTESWPSDSDPGDDGQNNPNQNKNRNDNLSVGGSTAYSGKSRNRRNLLGGGRRRSSLRFSIKRVASRRKLKGGNGMGNTVLVKASNYNHVHELVSGIFDERSVGVTGFRNLGNTCFLNSSLQCLSATIPLTDYFLGYDYRKEINKGNVLGTGGALATSYAELMKSVWLSKEGVISPWAFKSNLEKFAPQFRGGMQHDAQELLSFLLDGIHEDLNRVKDRPYIEDVEGDGSDDGNVAMKAWQNYLRRNKSVVVDLFQGQLRNTLTCRNSAKACGDGEAGCGHKSVKFEPFMYLSLPLSHETSTLDDCLRLFMREETLSGSNKWYCSKCKEHVEATKKFDLWMLPPILIVHLKRFKMDNWGRRSHKLKQRVRYPVRRWDMSSLMMSENHETPVYDLYAVSNHYGDLGSGHYTAQAIHRTDDRWYEFNDCRVSEIPSKTMGNDNSAYVLFYNRTSVSAMHHQHKKRKLPVVRRQSVDRPELWPHLQTRAQRESLCEYRRPATLAELNGKDDGENENVAEGESEGPEADTSELTPKKGAEAEAQLTIDTTTKVEDTATTSLEESNDAGDDAPKEKQDTKMGAVGVVLNNRGSSSTGLPTSGGKDTESDGSTTDSSSSKSNIPQHEQSSLIEVGQNEEEAMAAISSPQIEKEDAVVSERCGEDENAEAVAVVQQDHQEGHAKKTQTCPNDDASKCVLIKATVGESTTSTVSDIFVDALDEAVNKVDTTTSDTVSQELPRQVNARTQENNITEIPGCSDDSSARAQLAVASDTVGPNVSKLPATNGPESPNIAKLPPTNGPETPTIANVLSTNSSETPTIANVPSTNGSETPTIANVPPTNGPETPTIAKVPPTNGPETPTIANVPATNAPSTPTVAQIPHLKDALSPNTTMNGVSTRAVVGGATEDSYSDIVHHAAVCRDGDALLSPTTAKPASPTIAQIM